MLFILGASNPLRNPRRRRRWLPQAKSTPNHISNWTPNRLRPKLLLLLPLQAPTAIHQPANDEQRLVAKEITNRNARPQNAIHRPVNPSLRRRAQRRLARLHPILRLKIRRKQIALRTSLMLIENPDMRRTPIPIRTKIQTTNQSCTNYNHSQRNNQNPQKNSRKKRKRLW